MKIQNTHLLMHYIRGSIGKKYVVKHYRKKVVVTRFPDMSQITPSERQRACRNIFWEAVAYAKALTNDPEKKRMLQERSGKKHHLFNAAIQEYMRRVKETKHKEKLAAGTHARKCCKQPGKGSLLRGLRERPEIPLRLFENIRGRRHLRRKSRRPG